MFSMTNPKLLLVSDKFPPNIGGMESHAYEFINYFSSDTDINFAAAITFKKEFVPDSLPANRVCLPDSIILKYIDPTLTIDSIADPAELQAALDRYEIGNGDVVFFNSLYWIRIFPELKRISPGVKLVLRSGGNDILQSQIDGEGSDLKQRQQYVVDAINQSLDKLVINSSYSHRRFVELGINEHLMVQCSGGVDTERFYPPSNEKKQEVRMLYSLPADKKIILASTRLVSFKGFPYALEAITQLSTTVPFHYLIVGDGPEKQSIKRLIHKMNLRGCVSLAGGINFAEISNFFQASDIYFHMPISEAKVVNGGTYVHTETMGRCFCEAAASGLPSVSTDVGGISDVLINGKTGVLVAPNDTRAAAFALKILLENDRYRGTMGQQARLYAEKFFGWETIFKKYKGDVFK